MRVFGVILAGGRATRMGGADKALLPLAGRPLVAHALDRLRPQVEQILISANGDPSRFSAFDCPVIDDAVRQGPLAGVLAALGEAGRRGATHLVSLPVDTPFIPGDLVARLLLAAQNAPQGLAIASTADGDHPATAIWPMACAAPLAAFLAQGQARITDFTGAHQAARAQFAERSAFLNLNTPEDLAEAEAILRGAA